MLVTAKHDAPWFIWRGWVIAQLLRVEPSNATALVQNLLNNMDKLNVLLNVEPSAINSSSVTSKRA